MHTFRGMVGYCMKDRDELHFQKVEHNIIADDMNEEIELHSLYDADALKNKVCLTPTNVFDHCLMYWKFKLNHPSGNRFLDILQRMLQGDIASKHHPLRAEITNQVNDLRSVLENVSMDEFAMQIAMLGMHMQNLSNKIGLFKVQMNKLAALVQRLSIVISKILI
ncbi:hypothetical protein L7F22_056706 [Adiantum nelumboides]|nr:hypothetical protein [Adiantum nelumboides]